MSKVRKIGDLATLTNTKVNTIRYYEEIGLMPVPSRTASGRRTYGETETERLTFIRQSRALGFPIDAVRDLLALADDASKSCEAVDQIARHHLAEIDRKIANLSAMRTELDKVIGSCSRGSVAECKIIQSLSPPRPAG